MRQIVQRLAGSMLFLGVLCAGLAALRASAAAASPAQSTPTPAEHGEPELDIGTFSCSATSASHPTAWVWSRIESGVRKETWILVRPGTSGGWTFPGYDHATVECRFDWEGTPTHGTESSFETWVENEYTTNWPALGIDKDEDFEVHVHTVEIL